MHESIFILLNILIGSFIIKKLYNINNYDSYIISFIILWILFLNVNPYKLNNNSKYKILSYIPDKYLIKMNILSTTDINSIAYPVIFKPIICTTVSKNVKVIRNIEEANNYMKRNDIDLKNIMVQKFITFKNEIGILYEKNLMNSKGSIISMVRKYSSNSDIMDSCFGENECEDLTYLVTPQLNFIIDEISNYIPDFYVGRYDIKYKNLESLLQGKEFYILEVNGTMGFDLRKSHKDVTLFNNIYFIERWLIYRLYMGFKNIITLKGYRINILLYVMVRVIINTIKCKDWEQLFALYS
jgi:hypothetical protein